MSRWMAGASSRVATRSRSALTSAMVPAGARRAHCYIDPVTHASGRTPAANLMTPPSEELDQRDGPRDECGVFGIYGPEHDVSRLAYFALYALQHRGQESAGIAAADA